ncbi:hypothetical protein Tco_0578582 [Tanacetum coccineum]
MSRTVMVMVVAGGKGGGGERIRLYYLGKENGENILYSIDEGPFKTGKFRETLADGALGLTPTDDLIENLTKTVALLAQFYKTHLPQTNNQLRTSSNTRNQVTVQNGRVVVQNVQGRQNRVQGNNARGVVATGNKGVRNRVGNANPGGQDSTFDDDADEPPIQDFPLNVDQVFQADQCDAFESDVD